MAAAAAAGERASERRRIAAAGHRFYCKKSHYPLFNGLANIFPALALATDSCNFSGCLSLRRTDGGRGGIMATPLPYANVATCERGDSPHC